MSVEALETARAAQREVWEHGACDDFEWIEKYAAELNVKAKAAGWHDMITLSADPDKPALRIWHHERGEELCYTRAQLDAAAERRQARIDATRVRRAVFTTAELTHALRNVLELPADAKLDSLVVMHDGTVISVFHSGEFAPTFYGDPQPDIEHRPFDVARALQHGMTVDEVRAHFGLPPMPAEAA